MSNFFTESFDQFANKLGPTDIALYAGAGLVLWILFKDKMSPIQTAVSNLLNKVKKPVEIISVPSNVVPKFTSSDRSNKEDVFFKLVNSWKQTRDLAVLSGCDKAVEVADQMFPFLSPSVCEKKEVKDL
jgi:hypothetical protein